MNPSTPKQRPAPPAETPRTRAISWWRTYMRASRLVGAGNYAAAEVLFRHGLDHDPTDWFARLMLSNCCERQGRLAEALTLAEQCAKGEPPSLFALQAAIRLALAIEEHDKVDAYVRRALALPEVQNEIPNEIAFPTDRQRGPLRGANKKKAGRLLEGRTWNEMPHGEAAAG